MPSCGVPNPGSNVWFVQFNSFASASMVGGILVCVTRLRTTVHAYLLFILHHWGNVVSEQVGATCSSGSVCLFISVDLSTTVFGLYARTRVWLDFVAPFAGLTCHK